MLLVSFPILEYDRKEAEWHAQERARLAAIGPTPPFVNGQIAAIARQHGLILVTSNTRDFQVFEGPTLELGSEASSPTALARPLRLTIANRRQPDSAACPISVELLLYDQVGFERRLQRIGHPTRSSRTGTGRAVLRATAS